MNIFTLFEQKDSDGINKMFLAMGPDGLIAKIQIGPGGNKQKTEDIFVRQFLCKRVKHLFFPPPIFVLYLQHHHDPNVLTKRNNSNCKTHLQTELPITQIDLTHIK